MADPQTVTVVSASGSAAGISVDTPPASIPGNVATAQVSPVVVPVSTPVGTVTVVAATGVAVFGNPTMADVIGEAMRQAIQKCLDEGVIDPDVQRQRVLAARDAALNG